MTPAERHTAILAALDERIRYTTTSLPIVVFGGTTVPDTTAPVLAGRRRILERHAPVSTPGWDGCDATGERWPCSDYLDAAAGLLDEDAS